MRDGVNVSTTREIEFYLKLFRRARWGCIMVFLQLIRWQLVRGRLLHWMQTSLPFPAFLRDRRAVTSIEYVIIAVIVAVAIMGGLSRAGGYISTGFNQASSEL
jgi:Flp pilus assembly pilin Flp